MNEGQHRTLDDCRIQLERTMSMLYFRDDLGSKPWEEAPVLYKTLFQAWKLVLLEGTKNE